MLLGGMNFLRNPAFILNNNALIANTLNLAGNVLSQRFASKKAGGSTRNKKGKPRPKHRGIHYQDGEFVQKGTMLVTQNKLRCHPGLNVGFGRNGTLFALETGRVMVTCEKIEPNLDHSWIARTYAGRNLENVYKKYFHVLPLPQHYRFKLFLAYQTEAICLENNTLKDKNSLPQVKEVDLIYMEDVVEKYSVSSVLNKDVRNYGKQHLFDGNEETCWSSDEGCPQWIRVSFKKDVLLDSVVLQFQGGFAGSNCEVEVGDNLVRTFIPENTNAIQEVIIAPPVVVSATEPVKIVFCESTDFFGRIILYRLGFGVIDRSVKTVV